MSTAVREALLERNRSQRWLAARVGISEKHVSQMLTGSIEGSLDVWDDMLRELDLALAIVPRDKHGWPIA